METIKSIFNLNDEERKKVGEIIERIVEIEIDASAAIVLSAFSVLSIQVYDQMHEANVSKDALMYLANKINMATIASIKDM